MANIYWDVDLGRKQKIAAHSMYPLYVRYEDLPIDLQARYSGYHYHVLNSNGWFSAVRISGWDNEERIKRRSKGEPFVLCYPWDDKEIVDMRKATKKERLELLSPRKIRVEI